MNRTILNFCCFGVLLGFNALFAEPSLNSSMKTASGKSAGPTVVAPAKSGGIQGIEDPRKRKLGRKLASSPKLRQPKHWFLGPSLNFDGPLGKVSSGSSLSRGIGVGGGLSLSYQQPEIRFEFQPCYRYLRLGRTIDGSGVLVDPSPAEFTQTVQYFGSGGWISFLVEEGSKTEQVLEPSWWVDLGTEFLLPLSAKQTSSIGNEISLQAQKLWLVLAGGTVDFEVQRAQNLQLRLHLFYNLPGTSQGRLLGVRAQIAFDFGLL